MKTKKLFINNRNGLKLCVLVEQPENATKLVFIEHGFSGFKEQLHIEHMAQIYQQYGYITVRFDATHALGESDGALEDATVGKHLEDLEDVIQWASEQDWYIEPFSLAGHSMGGITTTLYAEQYPEKISCLAPTSTMVSGKLWLKSYQDHQPETLQEWQNTGYKESESLSKPGVVKRVSWQIMEESQNHDVMPDIDRLTMPVLLIVGRNDNSTPVDQHELLLNALPGPKELHIIEDCGHTFRAAEQLDALGTILSNWLDKHG